MMKLELAPILLLLCASSSALADPMSEARAIGQGAVNTIHEGITHSGAQWAQPAIEASPGGNAPYGVDPASAPQEGNGVRAQCAANPTARPECAALNSGGDTRQSGVYSQAAQAVPEEAQKLRSGQLPLSGALTGVGISGHYSACSTRTVSTGRKYFDEQYCHNYFIRELDSPCAKDLDVEVTWHYACPNGTSGPTLSDPAWSAGDPAPHHCERYIEDIRYFCDGSSIGWAAQYGTYCFDPKTGGFVGYPRLEDHSYTETFPANQWAVERDIWRNHCAGYESRVPPGLVPPDGETTPTGPAVGPGPVDKCERSSAVCSQTKQTRSINNWPVTRKCWQYTNTYSCVNLDPKSDCGQPRWGVCSKLDTQCVDWDNFISPAFCTAEQSTFSCMVEDTTQEQEVTDCAGQVFQDSNSVTWDTGHEPDSDLGMVAAYMEAGREAGVYLDPTTLEIFKGYDSRCKKKLFGLVNCCNKGGSGSGSLFSNSAIAAATTAGKAGVSTYMYDALFASDAPNMVINGFASVFGSGTSSALAGLLAGEVSVQGFLSALVPGPWSLAMLALQFSGLMSCKESDIETALKRDARLCVGLGAYCSRKLPLIGTCLERTYSHCCFNSLLAKAINTQGKAMLGLGMGTARNPNCGGFTSSQLQRLDLSALDLSEFMDQVNPTAVSPGATSCYFQGETSCPAVH